MWLQGFNLIIFLKKAQGVTTVTLPREECRVKAYRWMMGWCF